MKTLPFVLLVSTLSFARLAGAEQAGETNDPDDSERLQFTEKDLPTDEKDPAGPSEIDDFARRRGFNYARVTRRAARGDPKALKQFFTIARTSTARRRSRMREFRPRSITFSATRSSRSSSTLSPWRIG